MVRNHGPFIVAIPQDDDVIHFRTRAALASYRTTQAFERAPRLDPTPSTLLGKAGGAPLAIIAQRKWGMVR